MPVLTKRRMFNSIFKMNLQSKIQAASLRAAIFDMDGLLIDSEPLWCRAEQRVFGRLGIRLTEAMCAETRGLRSHEVVAYWHRRQPWQGETLKVVEGKIVAEAGRLIETQGKALAGVMTTLAAFKRHGYRLALASSSPYALIETVVAKLGIGGYFEVICSATEEKFGKPHPAIYLTTARRLGVPPVNCLALEDSIAGVQAAKAAGMQVIAVPAASQFDAPEFEQADLKLRSLEEFSIALL
jgi:sugar-phosphatase